MLCECAEKFRLYDLTEFYHFKDHLPVVEGKTNSVKIGTSEKFLYPLTEDEVKKLKFEYTLPDSLTAPMKKGQQVGQVEIFLDNNLLFSEKIFTIEDVKPKSVLQRMKDFFGNW